MKKNLLHPGTTLNDVMSLDRVVEVSGGEVYDSQLFAPDVYYTIGSDGRAEAEIHSHEWEFISGRSNQHGYDGPIFHQSEIIGGGLEKLILGNDGVYVAVPVIELDPEDYDDVEWAGWALLKKTT